MPTNVLTGQKCRTPPTQQQTATIKMNIDKHDHKIVHKTIAKWRIRSSTAAGTTTMNEDSTNNNNVCRDGVTAELTSLSEGENFVTVSSNDNGTPHNNNISIVKGYQKLYINDSGHIKGSTAEYDGTSESVANETQKGDKPDNNSTAVLCIDVDNISNCIAVKDIRLDTNSDDSNATDGLKFFIARKVISSSSSESNNNKSLSSKEKEKTNQQNEDKEDGMSIDSDNTTSGYGTDDEKELNDKEVKEGEEYTPTKKEVDTDENGKLLYHSRELLPRRQLRVLQVGDRIILCQSSEVCYKFEYLSSGTSTNNVATAVAPQEEKMGEDELDNTNNNSAESKSFSSYLSGEVAVKEQDYVSGITTTDDRSSAENKEEKEEVQVMKDAEKDDTSTKTGGLKVDEEVGSGGDTDDGKPSEKAPHEEIGMEVDVKPLEVEYPDPDPDDTGKSQETSNFFTAAENQNTTEDDGDNDSDQELLSLTPADGKKTAVKFEVDTNANEGSETDESGPDVDKTQAFNIPQNIKDKTEEQSFSSTADEEDKDRDDDSTTCDEDKNEEMVDKKSSPPIDINMEDNTPTTHNLDTVKQLDDEITNVKDKTDDQSNETESIQNMSASNEDVGEQKGSANLDISEPFQDREKEEQKMSDDDDTSVDEEGEGKMSAIVDEKELKLPENKKEDDDETTDGEGEGQKLAIDENKEEQKLLANEEEDDETTDGEGEKVAMDKNKEVQVTAVPPTKPDELPDTSKDDDETTVGDENMAIEDNDQQQSVPLTNLDTQPDTSNQEEKEDDDTIVGEEDMDGEDKKEPATAAVSTNLDTQPEASNHEEKEDDDDTTVGDEEEVNIMADEGNDEEQALSVPTTNLDTQSETSNQEEKDGDTTVGEEENDGDQDMSANENEVAQLEIGAADKSKGENMKDNDSTVCDDEQQISPSAKHDSECNGNEEKESVNEDIEESKDNAPILNLEVETTAREDKDDDSTCDDEDQKMPANEDAVTDKTDAPAETAEGDVGYDSSNIDNQATQGYPTMEPQPSPVKSYDAAKKDDDSHCYDAPTQQSFQPEEVPSKPINDQQTEDSEDKYNAETEPILQHGLQHDSPAKSNHSEEAEEEDDTERPQLQEDDSPAANHSEADEMDISSRKVDETKSSTSDDPPTNDTEAVEEQADDEQPEATSAASLKTTEEDDDQSTSTALPKPQEESTTSNMASDKPEEDLKDADSSQKSNNVDDNKGEEEEEEGHDEEEEPPKAKEDAPEDPIKSPSPDNKEPPEQQDAASDEEETTTAGKEEEVIDDKKEDLSTPKSSRTKRKRGAATSSTGKRKHDSGAIRIMFTGIEPSKKQLQMIDDIGAQLVSKIEDASTATHVIASDGKTKLRRTPKLMICLCKTDNILKLKWLEQSAKEQKVLDTSKFILNDKQAEKTYNFTMKETLKNGNEARLNNGGVLGGWYVYITKGVAGNKAPSAKEFQLLLSASGASQLTSLSESAVTNPEKTIMITNDPPLAKQTSDKGVKRVTKLGGHVLTTTWLFNTFITQKASIDDDDEEEEEIVEKKGRKRKAATPSSGSNRKSSRRR